MRTVVSVGALVACFCIHSPGQPPEFFENRGPVTSQLSSKSTAESVARIVLESILTKCQWKDERGRAADSYFYFTGRALYEFRNGAIGKFVTAPVKAAEDLNRLEARGYISMTAEVFRTRYLDGPWTSFSDDVLGRVVRIEVAKRDGKWFFARSSPASENDFRKSTGYDPTTDPGFFGVHYTFDPDAAASHRVSCAVATGAAR